MPALALEKVASPDGNVVVSFDVKGGEPVYSVDYKGKPVVLESHMGLELDSENGRNVFSETIFTGLDHGGNVDKLSLYNGFELRSSDRSSFDETWRPVWGEESEIRNHYNELAVTLNQPKFDRSIIIRFRVYDDGMGFRYEFPQQKNLNYFVIREERTQFAMTGDHTA